MAGKKLLVKYVEHKIEDATTGGVRTDVHLGHFFVLFINHSATSIDNLSLLL